MLLAGDVGGTNTRLALFERREGRLEPAVIDVFPSREFAGLEELIREFMAAQHLTVRTACFGVAGPVRRGRVETSNLAWVVDASQLATCLGLRSVKLLNDLEANAYGIAELGRDDFVALNDGDSSASGNAALISAGTGLGEAGLQWETDR